MSDTPQTPETGEDLVDFDTMSDEEFEAAFDLTDDAAAGTTEVPDSGASQQEEAEEGETPNDGSTAGETAEEETPDPEAEAAAAPDEAVGAAADDGEAAGDGEADGEDKGEVEETPAPETPAPDAAPADTIDYKAEFEKIMAPFKANGREVKLTSPEEVVRLMQMGAHYTKKMQALKPNMRLMRMLENNGLLDESKLNFLIDLDKRNPQAISKLLADSKIDPMDLDTSEDRPAYKPGNHSVSDAEMAFHDALTDVGSTKEGRETIHHIESSWDDASKQAVYREPEILQIIDTQRANGIYDAISAEIDRQRMLGNLKTTSFIDAYREIGDQLHAAGKLPSVQPVTTPAPQPSVTAPAAAPQPARRVVETRVATPPKTADSGKVKATTPARSAKPARQEFSPFALSDEEFMASTEIPV